LQQAISVTGSNLRLLGNVNISNDLIVSGNIEAQNYIVSSSVTYMTTSFSSGSTTFGNDVTDTHNFTGSVYVVGNISSSATITAATHSGFILANNAVVSSSAQFVNYGALLTSSNSGKQAVSGTLIVSGTTSLTGSTIVNLVGVQSGSFRVQNGTTQIDSVLLVSNNDYVANGYVGGVVNVGDYIAGGNTAKFDGGVHISGSLRVLGNAQGSGSYFTGSVQITGNEAVSGNLQVVGNTSVSGNFIGTTISASSTVTASSLRVEGLTRINGEFDVDNTTITLGAGGNAVADETRLNTLNLRVDSDTFFNSNITAISGSTRVKSLGINDLSESRIPYVDSTDTLIDNANFTYNGVTFKIGGGRFEVDDATGNIRTSGSLSVGALNISNNLNVAGAVGIQSTLTVTGSTLISSSLRVTNTASIAHLVVTGSTTITGSANISGNLSVGGTSRVSGNFAVSGTLDISGSATFDSYVNITGGLAVTGGFSAKGAPILLGDESTDRTIISGTLELSGSYYRNTTDIKSARSPLPIETLTQAQAWSSSFTTPSSASGAFIRTPDEFLEVFVGQGSNQRRYVMPVWLDETLYADDYFDISVVDGADSDYVY
jgi:cytoskeletal protein CcmA (bactofilin family)